MPILSFIGGTASLVAAFSINFKIEEARYERVGYKSYWRSEVIPVIELLLQGVMIVLFIVSAVLLFGAFATRVR